MTERQTREATIRVAKAERSRTNNMTEEERKELFTRVHARRSVARFAVWRRWKNGAVIDVRLLLVGHPYTLQTARFHTSTSAT